MDNITIKSVEKYLNETLQGSDNGNYIIVEVEGTNEDDLDDKAVILDEICTENGASSVLVADHNKIWQARKAFAEAVRAESLIVCKEDVVVPVDQEALLLDEILRLSQKYNLITRIASHAGDGNIHLNILKGDDDTYEAGMNGSRPTSRNCTPSSTPTAAACPANTASAINERL